MWMITFHGRRLNHKGKVWLSGLIIIICLVITLIFGIRHLMSSKSQALPDNPNNPKFSASMDKKIRSLSQKYPALKNENYDMTIYDVSKKKTYHWEQGKTEQMYTASTIKVPILVEYLHQKPKLSVNDKKMVARMIRESNNNDATTLFKKIGGTDGLNQMFKRFGMKDSQASSHWWLSTISSKDYVTLLKNIFIDSKLINQTDRNYIISEMVQVNIKQQWGINGFDENASFLANKNGWTLSGTWIMDSIGAIEVKGRMYLISIMSNQHPDGQGQTGLSTAKKELTKVAEASGNYILSN